MDTQTQTPNTPSLPEAQNPGFMNADPADMMFVIDENSGELRLANKTSPQQLDSVQQPSETQDDVRFRAAVEDAATQQITEPNPLEEKFNVLQNQFTQLVAYLQGQMQGQQPQQVQQQEESVDLNELDGAGLVKLINSAVEKAFATRMQPIEERMSIQDVREEYNTTSYKYGQDFVNLTPAMVEIKKSDPKLPWETIYLSLKNALKVTQGNKSTASDSTIQTGNGSQRQPQPAQTLVQRANKLATENGSIPNGVVNQRPAKMNLDQAFAAALDEIGLSN